VLREWPLFLERLTHCFWVVYDRSRFHCAATTLLEPAAESLVNILHSYGMHLAQTATRYMQFTCFTGTKVQIRHAPGADGD
jgi:hypothetical protein